MALDVDEPRLAASADEAGAPDTPTLPLGMDWALHARACSLIMDWEMGDIPNESDLAIALFTLFRAEISPAQD